MRARTLLWADLRVQPGTTDFRSWVPPLYRVEYLRDLSKIRAAPEALSPEAACFEYDEPGREQLEVLEHTRREYPWIPVLMLTVKHSEELAVWALRIHLWDYIVLPVSRSDLGARLSLLVGSRAMSAARETILRQEPLAGVPLDAPKASAADCRKMLLPALSYIEENYSEKVALGAVARLCGVGRYQFSRIFKRVHGTTFREFLIERRINKAIHMLERPGASITDVAFAVGFNDLSHFARLFRRHVGVCPSDYVQEIKMSRR